MAGAGERMRTANRLCLSRDEFRRFLDEELPADAEQSFVEHLDSCPACQTRLEELAAGAEDWSNVRKFLCEDSSPFAEADGLTRHLLMDRDSSLTFSVDCEDSTQEFLNYLAPTDDPEIREIVVEFLETLALSIEQMGAANHAHNYDELVRLAHWLKGAGGTVGFDCFTEPAKQLEQYAVDRSDEQIEQTLERLRSLEQVLVV